MNNILAKIKDTLLCAVGTVLVLTMFAVIVVVGKPNGSLSHCPLKPFTATVKYIGGSK